MPRYNDPNMICRLLRAIAGGTDAEKSQQCHVFLAAADLIEAQQKKLDEAHSRALHEAHLNRSLPGD